MALIERPDFLKSKKQKEEEALRTAGFAKFDKAPEPKDEDEQVEGKEGEGEGEEQEREKKLEQEWPWEQAGRELDELMAKIEALKAPQTIEQMDMAYSFAAEVERAYAQISILKHIVDKAALEISGELVSLTNVHGDNSKKMDKETGKRYRSLLAQVNVLRDISRGVYVPMLNRLRERVKEFMMTTRRPCLQYEDSKRRWAFLTGVKKKGTTGANPEDYVIEAYSSNPYAKFDAVDLTYAEKRKAVERLIPPKNS